MPDTSAVILFIVFAVRARRNAARRSYEDSFFVN
jgi:hypothetical protein